MPITMDFLEDDNIVRFTVTGRWTPHEALGFNPQLEDRCNRAPYRVHF